MFKPHLLSEICVLYGTGPKERATVAEKKTRIIHLTMRLSCACQMAWERGTFTQHMPATNAPRRCEPMKGTPVGEPAIGVQGRDVSRTECQKKF